MPLTLLPGDASTVAALALPSRQEQSIMIAVLLRRRLGIAITASIRHATGLYDRARSAARPSRDSEARVTGRFGRSIDIDVYKKTVATLRERERELSQL